MCTPVNSEEEILGRQTMSEGIKFHVVLLSPAFRAISTFLFSAAAHKIIQSRRKERTLVRVVAVASAVETEQHVEVQQLVTDCINAAARGLSVQERYRTTLSIRK